MPRLVRLPSFPFGWYYVALRSVSDRKIVTNPADLLMILKLLRLTLRRRGARLHAGYIAEREVHLAVQVGQGPLSAITGSFQHEYARLFNRAHGERGSLFRLHYHVLLFQHQRWLVPLIHFIHWIPRLEAPSDYSGGLCWSTDAAYRGSAKEDWVTTNVGLRMLTRGAYNRQIQEDAYRELMDQAPETSYARLFRRGSEEDSRLLGDDQFIRDTWRLTGRRLPDRTRRPSHFEGDISGVVIEVVEQFNALCDERLPPHQAAAWKRVLAYENVRSRSRKRPLPLVRALTASYLIEHELATSKQAAHFFGCGPRAVSVRRRHFYEDLFREWFGADPAVLFSRRRDADGGVIARKSAATRRMLARVVRSSRNSCGGP